MRKFALLLFALLLIALVGIAVGSESFFLANAQVAFKPHSLLNATVSVVEKAALD